MLKPDRDTILYDWSRMTEQDREVFRRSGYKWETFMGPGGTWQTWLLDGTSKQQVGRKMSKKRKPLREWDEASRQQERERNIINAREKTQSIRDIGEIPEVVNPDRKKNAERDFKFFAEQYFPHTFSLAWSPDHLRVIAKIEQVVLDGGLFAIAMPRGSGKTSLCEIACIWAMLYGHREFVVLIGPDEKSAEQMLKSIKSEFENSESLLEDFPEAVFPICQLEGIHQRASGQIYHGKLTNIGWTAHELRLPTIEGSKASGSVIRVAGLTGRIRGLKHKRADGVPIRPSLVLLDDPQTDQSANSLSQCATRERILAGAILGLAGPGKKIAGLATVTVIREGDMADRILDRSKHPQWQGERTKMMYSFPKNEKMWERYAEIRHESLKAERGLADATEFYQQNREAMDAGASIAWPERFNYDEVSAIQHAMNLKLQDEAAFFAEYQNEPLTESLDDADLLTADQIAAKTNGHKRGEIPVGCTHLTAFVDVQQQALFWLLAGWEDDFTGYVVDYGTEPDQKRAYFALRSVKRTLAMSAKGTGLEGAIYAGLQRVADHLLGREWRRDDGAMVKVDRMLIDANWGESTDVVKQFCRQSGYAASITPSHGKYVGAAGLPFGEYRPKRGDRVGLNWRIPVVQGRNVVRHVLYDTNWWKSFIHARLSVGMGDPGCLSLFGRDPKEHRLLAEHLTAEYRVKTEGRNRTVDEWKIRATHRDNHWLDCLVGAAVAASMSGATIMGEKSTAKPKRVSFAEMQRRARARG